MQLADLYRQGHKYERAVTLWTMVVDDKEAPAIERIEAYRQLAEIYLRRLEFELAKKALDYALALDMPVALRGQCLYDLARMYLATDEPREAIKQLRAVLALPEIPRRQHALAAYILADTLELLGQRQEALHLFESIRTVYPNALIMEQRINYLKNSVPMRNATLPAPEMAMPARRTTK